MAYAGIDKKRFAELLNWGTDDDELRRFFTDCRLQLIQKGAKVQNLPHGKAARLKMLTNGLPPATDKTLQKWCSENLTMVNPDPVAEIISTLQVYEDAGESLPEDEAKRLSRSCLVHLFAAQPPTELMTFLKGPPSGVASAVPDLRDAVSPQEVVVPVLPELIPPAFGAALVALAEGKDPDEQLAALTPAIAALVSGVHAVRAGRYEEARSALESLDDQKAVRDVLADFAARSAAAQASRITVPQGLKMVQFFEPEGEVGFDFTRDQIIGICTKDYPANAVFVQPIAIRTGGGNLVALSSAAQRETLFPQSGDLIAFAEGRDTSKQPRRGEMGIWSAAENRIAGPSHRTNFHISGEKVPVFDVRVVPFASTEHDSVRAYIQHQVQIGGPALAKTSLFLLRDELIVGCSAGKDLTKDEGFEAGLPCWRALMAFRFEGRTLIPGPLPAPEIYECEALASSLRKLFTADKTGTDKLTRAQFRKLQDMLVSGSVYLNAARVARLQAELSAIEEHDESIAALVQVVMDDPRVSARVDDLVKAKADAEVAKKDQLRRDIELLGRQYAAALEKQRSLEKEQKALAPAIAKSIRQAFDKARAEGVATIGQVTAFKALMDELVEPQAALLSPAPTATVLSQDYVRPGFRAAVAADGPISETLMLLGVAPKSARALQTAGSLAHAAGLILIVEGNAARIAVEAWCACFGGDGKVLECGIGEVDDSAIREGLKGAPPALAVLDANLSPVDVYARPLIDAVQRRLSVTRPSDQSTMFLMSIADSVAALPLPRALESVSLRISLDRLPAFILEADVASRLDEMATPDGLTGWLGRLWRPAATQLLAQLRSMPVDDAALALSALEVEGT
jgi:hypothetical protein